MFAHIDADSFFASVLVRKNPKLRGKPLLALGMGGGCVIAASYEAKAFGVKTGMPLKEAKRLCPNALHVNSDFHEAARASQEIESILEDVCPLMEQMSIDEWYLDLQSVVGGLPKNVGAWGLEIQQTVLRKTGLSVSVGIAPTKLLAKMAGEYRKPSGMTVISKFPLPPGVEGGKGDEGTRKWLEIGIRAFLADRPAAAIPGIGRKRVRHTDAHGWTTALHIAEAPTEELRALFGKGGPELKEELSGHPLFDISMEEEPPKSVSRCRSFRGTTDKGEVWAHLLKHAEYVTMKMRRDTLACYGCSVWLRNGAYEHGGRNISFPQAMDTVEAMTPYLRMAFASAWRERERYTQVGLALWRLIPRFTEQYSLFRDAADQDKSGSLQETMDILHKKFGRNSVTRAAALRVKSGTKVTLQSPVYESSDH